MNSAKSTRLLNLQVLRFIASLIVVFAHVELYRYSSQGIPWGMFSIGGLGVDIFFVISGFIMVHVSRDLGPGNSLQRAGRFFLKRLLRIVPLYYLFIALTILLTYVFMHTHAELNEQIRALYYTPNKLLDHEYILKSFTFSNVDVAPLYTVGWTLDLEFRFYLMFAVCIALRFPVWLFFTAFTALSVVGAFYPGPIVSAFFEPMYLEFSLGAVLYLLYSRFHSRVGVGGVMCIFAVAAFALCAFYDPYMATNLSGFLRPATWGVAAMCIVALFLLLEGRFTPPKFLVFMGNGSYSMYLTHWLVMTLIPETIFAFGLQGQIDFSVYVFGSVAIAVLASVAVYVWVERPINSGIARLMKRPPKNESPRQAGVADPA